LEKTAININNAKSHDLNKPIRCNCWKLLWHCSFMAFMLIQFHPTTSLQHRPIRYYLCPLNKLLKLLWKEETG